MNEQIKALAEKAGVVRTMPADVIPGITMKNRFTHLDLEKFAELIIDECVNVADHSNVTGKSIIGDRIKQHFGVEE